MNIQFKKLTPELTEDFLYFFETHAFSDHEEWAGCYCLESHVIGEEKCTVREKRRQKAIELIDSGIMNGYLLYDDTGVVGWVNAGDKADYQPICENTEFQTDNCQKGRIKILYCIDIAPHIRGRGIANLIFEKVIGDAKAEGYSYVEGYPYVDEADPYQYKGPLKLYKKYGFEICRKEKWFYIMRKTL